MGGEAGVHTHYRSEQEEEEGVDGGDPGAQRFFMGFEKEQDVGGDFRLRRCSVGPVWLSAASRSASTHTASTVLLTPGGHDRRVNL